MQLFSPPKTRLTFFSACHSPNSYSCTSPHPNPNFSHSFVKVPINVLASLLLLKSSCFSSKVSLASPLEEQIICSESEARAGEERDEEGEADENVVLSVRRPVKEGLDEVDDSWGSGNENVGVFEYASKLKIDQGISEFVKKMPMFEPERGVALEDKPLGINLELGLYRAKVLARNFQFKEAEQILQKCIMLWPEDGRPYVALGKLLCKQSKFAEARAIYERGSQATEGENPYIWQCWAVLENKIGNVRRARELFDAATVADKRHVAAWHGWAVLEIKQGNIRKARNLLSKGLKYSKGNEYIYQTLALLEAKGNRTEQARYLFGQATHCNPKSCASWLAWAQVEMQQENNHLARLLFEKAVQASPKNRFAWHVWALFEANQGNIEKGRKLLKIGHALNPRDPILLQSLALLEYRHTSANLARVLFRRASEIDPMHQPVWIAWGWMEWKEGNINTARELYRRAVSIDSTTESAARCLQAWGVLEQRVGNLSAARRLFKSSLNINSQSYVTWMTWAALEEEQGNAVRAEEIRSLYFQQRTEVVDDASWAIGLLDIFDPALDGIKRLLNCRRPEESKGDSVGGKAPPFPGELDAGGRFDLDAFVKEKLSLDASKLDEQMERDETKRSWRRPRGRDVWRSQRRTALLPESTLT
ncbi:PsbB mRNA maturation factor Mbb1, chloroplastic [Apostasia shenzhenica]|uniref:PsbB mRNA maturation factor Mbb1, chloroplastic n=1 Tax=Apostasia shenzhenica TaxID=1088818 RepID=A0A2I0AJV6_9ASPA|nr:PsbB mRNA maturation factor Mbb1, chloroplastic [Apostasia shenzhenica]